ncbi:MAG: GAF domain-containing protein, partial [Ilumatobacter sp.]|nr:GAF domain-containing protein [Ilumatobacter sp.]
MTEPAEASPRQPVAVPDLSEADLRRLVDQGPFGYLACTPQGRIERVNATLLDWAGYERAELVGQRSFQELLAAGDRIYFDTHIRPLLHMGGGVRDIAVELVTAAGERLSVLITVDRIATAGPELVEILVVDARARRAYERELVEERRRAEHAQERLQLSYELVSGFASAATVEDVQRVVTATNASPFTGVRCHMWLFSDDMRSMLHAGPTETDVVTKEFDISGQQIGSAFDELSSGRLVEVSTDMAARYPMITGWLAGTELTTAIFAPLVEDDALIGTLGFGFVDDHEFDDDERRAVRSLAEQTSNALRRARLVEARERARRQLEHLHEFGRSLGAAVTVEEVIAALSAAGHDQFGALDVRIGRLDRDGRLIISGGRRDEPAPTVVQPSS